MCSFIKDVVDLVSLNSNRIMTKTLPNPTTLCNNPRVMKIILKRCLCDSPDYETIDPPPTKEEILMESNAGEAKSDQTF